MRAEGTGAEATCQLPWWLTPGRWKRQEDCPECEANLTRGKERAGNKKKQREERGEGEEGRRVGRKRAPVELILFWELSFHEDPKRESPGYSRVRPEKELRREVAMFALTLGCLL